MIDKITHTFLSEMFKEGGIEIFDKEIFNTKIKYYVYDENFNDTIFFLKCRRIRLFLGEIHRIKSDLEILNSEYNRLNNHSQEAVFTINFKDVRL